MICGFEMTRSVHALFFALVGSAMRGDLLMPPWSFERGLFLFILLLGVVEERLFYGFQSPFVPVGQLCAFYQ